MKKRSGLSKDAAMGQARFVLCARNEGYPAALELREVYRVLEDARASRLRLVRVVDESGEDYLYLREWFAAVERS
jgi:hypothetical protein